MWCNVFVGKLVLVSNEDESQEHQTTKRMKSFHLLITYFSRFTCWIPCIRGIWSEWISEYVYNRQVIHVSKESRRLQVLNFCGNDVEKRKTWWRDPLGEHWDMNRPVLTSIRLKFPYWTENNSILRSFWSFTSFLRRNEWCIDNVTLCP